MSSPTRRRDLYVSLKLIVCIALGIWLGALAVFLTGLLYYKSLPPAQTQALDKAAAQLSAPPGQKAGNAAASPRLKCFASTSKACAKARPVRLVNRPRSNNSAPSTVRNVISGCNRIAPRPARKAVPASISTVDKP